MVLVSSRGASPIAHSTGDAHWPESRSGPFLALVCKDPFECLSHEIKRPVPLNSKIRLLSDLWLILVDLR